MQIAAVRFQSDRVKKKKCWAKEDQYESDHLVGVVGFAFPSPSYGNNSDSFGRGCRNRCWLVEKHGDSSCEIQRHPYVVAITRHFKSTQAQYSASAAMCMTIYLAHLHAEGGNLGVVRYAGLLAGGFT